MKGFEAFLVGLKDVVCEKPFEVGAKSGVSHKWEFDGFVGGRWCEVLVLEDFAELVYGHGLVGFFNVLPQPPEKEKVFDVVLHASEGSESQEGLLGLRCKVEEGEER